MKPPISRLPGTPRPSGRGYRSPAGLFSGSGQLNTSQHVKVIGNDRTPYIRLETFPARPIATPQPIAPLQRRNIRLDPGSKVSQPPIHPVTLGHLHDRQATFLGKDHVLDFCFPGFAQVCLRSKTAIGRALPGWTTVPLNMPLQQRDKLPGVGRVATLNQTIKNQVRRTAGQKHLVPEFCLAPPLDDYVGVRLKQRDDLLGCRYLLAFEHPSLGLVHNPPQQVNGPGQFLDQRPGTEVILKSVTIEVGKLGNRLLRILDHPPGIVQHIAVGRLSSCLLRGILDGQQPFLHDPSMIAATIDRTGLELFAIKQPAGDDPDPVPEQRGVSGPVDIRLHRGGVKPDLPAALDLFLLGVGEQKRVDRQPGVFAQGLNSETMAIMRELLTGSLELFESGNQQCPPSVQIFTNMYTMYAGSEENE